MGRAATGTAARVRAARAAVCRPGHRTGREHAAARHLARRRRRHEPDPARDGGRDGARGHVGGPPRLRLRAALLGADRLVAVGVGRRAGALLLPGDLARDLGHAAVARAPAVPPLGRAARDGAPAAGRGAAGDRLAAGARLRAGRDPVPVLLLRPLLRPGVRLARARRPEPGRLPRPQRHRELAARRRLRAARGPGAAGHAAPARRPLGAIPGRVRAHLEPLQLHHLLLELRHRRLGRAAVGRDVRGRPAARRLVAAGPGRRRHGAGGRGPADAAPSAPTGSPR